MMMRNGTRARCARPVAPSASRAIRCSAASTPIAVPSTCTVVIAGLAPRLLRLRRKKLLQLLQQLRAQQALQHWQLQV